MHLLQPPALCSVDMFNLLGAADDDQQNQGILKTAEDIVQWRERFFTMTEPIQITNDERNEIWPLVDNFYVRCGGGGEYRPPTRSSCHYMTCRFNRKQGTRQGTGKRQRKLREVNDRCGVRVKATWFYSEPPNEKGEGGVISHWLYERGSTSPKAHGADCSIDAIDAHKLNSAIRQTAGEAALSGLSAGDVVRIMRSKNLQAAGGKTLTVGIVHNNARIFKNGHASKKSNGGRRKRVRTQEDTNQEASTSTDTAFNQETTAQANVSPIGIVMPQQ